MAVAVTAATVLIVLIVTVRVLRLHPDRLRVHLRLRDLLLHTEVIGLAMATVVIEGAGVADVHLKQCFPTERRFSSSVT